jgi:hypothetical protein
MLVGVGAEDTAVSCFGAQDDATTGAAVDNHSGVGRHLLGFDKPALRAGDDGVQVYVHGYLVYWV